MILLINFLRGYHDFYQIHITRVTRMCIPKSSIRFRSTSDYHRFYYPRTPRTSFCVSDLAAEGFRTEARPVAPQGKHQNVLIPLDRFIYIAYFTP